MTAITNTVSGIVSKRVVLGTQLIALISSQQNVQVQSPAPLTNKAQIWVCWEMVHGKPI
jgi:hypothetical protein